MPSSAVRTLLVFSLSLTTLGGCLLDAPQGTSPRDSGPGVDARPDECDVDDDCDDSLFCNGFELCAGGRCEAGAPPRCADGPTCSVGICDEGVDGCVRLPDHARCEDDEQCSVSTGCVPVAPCDSDAACDDGFACNGVERCDVDRCVPGEAPTCDDGTACTLDVCSEGRGGCLAIPEASACSGEMVCDADEGCVPPTFCTAASECDDGNFCDGAERCVDGRCAPGDAPDCNDAVSCTVDLCDEAADACAHVPEQSGCAPEQTCTATGCIFEAPCDEASDCDDGVFCNGAEICTDGRCASAERVDCADTTACTADFCDEVAQACVNLGDDSQCGANERCDADAGCVAECEEPSDCDDGLFCNGAEGCVAGGCVAGTPPSCADAVMCTTDVCDETSDQCRQLPEDTACGANESCHITNGCIPECTGDGDCDDGAFCNGAETCAAGACLAGTPPNCDDSVACTTDACDETGDQCRNLADDSACGVSESCDVALGCVPECTGDGDCDDALYCNGAETCVSGGCVAGTAPVCDDSVDCTVDLCDEDGDRCLSPPDDAMCAGRGICDEATGCVPLGTRVDHPGPSCAAILLDAPGSPDGRYFVDADDGGALATREVYCDMTADGGGWMLVLETDASSAAHYTSAAVSDSLLLTPAIDGVAKHADDFVAAAQSASDPEVRVLTSEAPLFARGVVWSVPDPGAYASSVEAGDDPSSYVAGDQCYDGDAPCAADHWCFGISVVPVAEHVCVRRSATGGLWLDGGAYPASYLSGTVWTR